MELTVVAGARPNFLKIAPMIHAITEAHNQGFLDRFRYRNWKKMSPQICWSICFRRKLQICDWLISFFKK